MDKIIPFNKGIHREPSVGVDGELSELVNLVPVNGELKNVRGLEQIANLGDENNTFDVTLLGIHRFNGKTKYFVLIHDDELKIYTTYDAEEDKYDGIMLDINIGDFLNMVSNGAFVIINGTEGRNILYLEDGAYKVFSGYIPCLPLKYGITRSPTSTSKNSPDTDSQRKIYKELYNNAKKDGYLVEPALVRHVFRLFDGSLCAPSPIVYLPIGEIAPTISMDKTPSNDNTCYISKCIVNAKFISPYLCEEWLTKYGDLISSIEFYLSPIRLIGDNKVSDKTNRTFTSNGVSHELGEGRCAFARSEDEIKEEVIYASNFYLVHKVGFSDFLSSTLLSETITNGVDLTAIEGAELLDIDEPSGELFPSLSFVYNQRVIMSNITMHPYSVPYAGLLFSSYAPDVNTYELSQQEVIIKISKNGKTVYSYAIGPNNRYFDNYKYINHIKYLYYPDEYATALYLRYFYNENGELIEKMYEFPLSKHPLLRGAYWMYGIKTEEVTLLPNYMGENTFHYPNKVIVSDAGNPIIYSAINEIQVGSGEIIGLSNSSTAISTGQFGQYPLYAFCTDGIWALEVGEDGMFNRVSPVSRDVCNNPDSITQIDGAVVFTTDQGLMMIQGGEVVCLSTAMEGFNVADRDFFPKGFFASYGKEEFDELYFNDDSDFRKTLKTCKIAYDYTNRLLRIFPKQNKGIYYVFSLESREYASVYYEKHVKAVVADYPSSIIQVGDKLYRPSEEDGDTTKKGLLLTRPIMLDDAFTLKKLQDLRLHYSKFDGTSKCYVVVYASNDGTNWKMLKSLRRKAYKYCRFAILTEMKDIDALSGMVLRYETERTNKLR